MRSSSDELRVHCPRSLDLAVHSWEDGMVVYDDADGSLHALSPAAGDALVFLLSQSSVGANRLAELLVQEQPNESDIGLATRLLVEFEGMGFVERLPV